MTGLQSILGGAKLSVIRKQLISVLHSDIPGDIAELGVYKGGTSLLMAQMAADRKIHLFDTFDGMPVSGEFDVHKVGEFADTGFRFIQEVFSNFNAEIHEGFFPETTAGLEDTRYAFVHVDADQYQVTKDALEYFYPRMSVGGVIVLDDYLWQNCPGVEKALLEFLPGKPETLRSETAYQAYIVKE